MAYPLTSTQTQAAYSTAKNIRVIAGAGTGKTSTLLARLSYLIHEMNIPPKEILCLAFAKEAALEMKSRFQETYPHISPPHISTFHSLGFHIIQTVEHSTPQLSNCEQEEIKHALIKTFFTQKCLDPTYQKHIQTHFLLYPYYTEQGLFQTLQDDLTNSIDDFFLLNALYLLNKTPIYNAINPPSSEFSIYLPDENQWIGFEKSHPSPTNDVTQKTGLLLKKQDFDSHSIPYLKILSDYFQISPPLHTNIHTLLRTPSRIEYELFPLLWSIVQQEDYVNEAPCVLQDLVNPLIKDYENHLKKHQQIDFSIMIKKASDYIRSGLYLPPWRHILMDEYQDISKSRYQLIQSIREKQPHTHIFAVGDDAQAIYAFAGSRIQYILDFEEYFGKTQSIYLDQTFRFSNILCHISTVFINKNPQQIQKHLSSPIPANAFPIKLYWNHPPLSSLIQKTQNIQSVLILSRFHHQLPPQKEQENLIEQFPKLSIQFKTVHASKGQEADLVIITGLRHQDFPSQKTQQIKNHSQTAEYPFAEERRLFYVAMTRAKKHVYLVAPSKNPSVFFLEIQNIIKKYYKKQYIKEFIKNLFKNQKDPFNV